MPVQGFPVHRDGFEAAGGREKALNVDEDRLAGSRSQGRESDLEPGAGFQKDDAIAFRGRGGFALDARTAIIRGGFARNGRFLPARGEGKAQEACKDPWCFLHRFSLLVTQREEFGPETRFCKEKNRRFFLTISQPFPKGRKSGVDVFGVCFPKRCLEDGPHEEKEGGQGGENEHKPVDFLLEAQRDERGI